MGNNPGAGTTAGRWRLRGRWAQSPTRERIWPVWKYARWPAAVLGGLGLLGLATFLVLYLTIDLPSAEPARASSVVLDAQGRELATLSKDGVRVAVELEEVAPVVIDALIASEDRGFHSHGGIDPISIARALWRNATTSGTQGGSTITQQVVKNAYLNQDRTLVRKVKEAVLALKLERRDDKEAILERYLNTAYFGRGAYGIGAASKLYFDTTADQLQLPQAAMLIGLLTAPERADPTSDPDEATARRADVLDDMVEDDRLAPADAEAAKATELGAIEPVDQVTLTEGVAPHFVEWVRQQAIALFGEATVYGGGLKIHTTLDLDDQRAAEEAVAAVLTEPDDPQVALVASDRDGAIKAYVGGRDFETLKVDLVRGTDGGGTGRQPGSAFKPFVLAAALEKGITLGTRYPAPPSISLDTDSGPWTVDNYGREGYGALDLMSATANSVNTVYAQLMLEVGPANVARLAEKAGVAEELPAFPALALGTEEVAPVDLLEAYTTFVRDGERVLPYSIARIEARDGRTIYEAESHTANVMQEGSARAVNHALQAVVESGTGEAAALDRPAAGKTGTTQEYGDAWFAGYTPNYAAVVWMGYPEGPTHPMTDVHGRAVTGGSLPAEIWRLFMDRALEDVEEVAFEPPPDDLLAVEEIGGSLSVSPPSGPPGTVITVSGDGFERCAAGWYVTFDQLATPTETGSGAGERSAQVSVPLDAAPGPHEVKAWCDIGGGAEESGAATFTVDGEDESTTSSSEPSTTTSETTTTTTATTTTTKPKGGGTTTTSTTSTTTSSETQPDS